MPFRRRTNDAFLCRTDDLIPLCPVSNVQNAIFPVLIVHFIVFVPGCCQFSSMCRCLTCRNRISGCMFYRGAHMSLARPRRRLANVSVRMACISFGALPWWQLASWWCSNRALPWHASELVSFLVGLGTYKHPGINGLTQVIFKGRVFFGRSYLLYGAESFLRS